MPVKSRAGCGSARAVTKPKDRKPKFVSRIGRESVIETNPLLSSETLWVGHYTIDLIWGSWKLIRLWTAYGVCSLSA